MSELKRIFEYVRKHPGCTCKDMQPVFPKLSRMQLSKRINHLVYFGDIEKSVERGLGRGFALNVTTDKYDDSN